MQKIYIVSAAGGNNTAIAIIETALVREKYEEIGLKLLQETERKGVEQVGFLIPSIKHFEMSGGEFCGNAARSAALLLSKVLNEKEFSFTMSGFSGEVKATVEFDKNDSSNAVVSCYFKGLKAKVEEREVNSKKISVVDLGGIVHCVLSEPFSKSSYQEDHTEILTKLGLKDRSAVGVLWLSKREDGLKMDPVVWVKSINTFFYETSCGSGSIAVAIATGSTSVIQPSGKAIQIKVDNGGVELISEMKEIDEFVDSL